MISFVIAIAAIAAMALVMGALVRVQEAEMENKWIQEYTESIGELCDGLEEQKESVRCYYHDLSKHIRTLEAMIERQKERDCPDGETESVVKTQNADYEEKQSTEQTKIDDCETAQSAAYLEELKQFYESLHDAPRETDIYADEVINAILSTKMEECRKLQISFHICARVSEEEADMDEGMAFRKPDWISDSDMAAILLNLLDNAIEAQTRIPSDEQRWIWFFMGFGDDEFSGSFEPLELTDASETSGSSGLSASEGSRVLCIEVKNKVRADETISFQTRKPSPSEHGFGLRIIDSVIEKYHGSRKVQIDEEQHMFITRVTISGESL